ncbi:pentatricopeptide repeat-containing protein At3g29230-like [Telopea speciosissima]|uniref:pentatricopeptide repeat-containing protein At3g29230-like n=1 Tax=Telopea speciosissima TaxID=54955 RepID=UPI001CC741CA|nr:pentatricopeptide repeat-containing protein At3g29230-like [Telopea speciosissima]
MTHSPFSKLVLKNPILSLLQTSKKASEILQIQAQLTTTNLISDTFAASRLIISLTSGALSMNYAELVFSQIEYPSTFIWNTMIRGYIESSNPCRAFHFYCRMQRKNVLGDNHTYPYVLKACGLMLGLNEGREIHGEVLKRGFASDLFVRNALISMYCRCGDIVCGRTLFDGFQDRDLVSWNSMIGGYVRSGEMGEAQKMFDEMPERDVFAWAMMIDGYGKKLGDLSRGRELFDRMPDRDVACWNSMIDGYLNHGKMVAARELFEEMPKKNVITWSIMIDGYARFGNTKEALNLFNHMLHYGTKPDKICTMGAISACAQLGALDQGRWIHTYIQKNKIILDIIVQTALLDMYVKCGSLEEARTMFNSMPERNIISWNVMIAGLGIYGFGIEAVELFAQMEMQGMPMDDLIFLSVLTACSHAGLVTKGLDNFKKMTSVYGIKPKLEHYGCLVDLLGRAGQLDEAKNVIQSMPMKPNSALWGSLLAACKTYQNVPLAEVSVGKLVELKADDCGVYVILSNIYAEEGMWEHVLKVRKLMSYRGIKKEAGRSVIEVDGEVEEFVNGKRSHSLSEEIDLVIRSLSMMIISVG